MTDDMKDIQRAEVVANVKVFRRLLDDNKIALDKYGMFALMKDKKIVEYFSDSRDALMAGSQLYGDKPFSIQEVTKEPVHSGFASHAVV